MPSLRIERTKVGRLRVATSSKFLELACPHPRIYSGTRLRVHTRVQGVHMRRLLWIALGLWIATSLTGAAQAEEWTKTYDVTGQPELRVDTSDAQIHVDTWDQKK